jgi:hypothetical protein
MKNSILKKGMDAVLRLVAERFGCIQGKKNAIGNKQQAKARECSN